MVRRLPKELTNVSVNVFRIWFFLRLNRNKWFTAKEISEYTGIDIWSVSDCIKTLDKLPRIEKKQAVEQPYKPTVVRFCGIVY